MSQVALKRLLWTVTVVGIVLWLLLSWVSLSFLMEYLVSDDAFYYFTIARNAVRGHGVTFDGVTPTNGFHPLWLVSLLPIYRVAGGDAELALRLSLSLGALFSTGAILLLGVAVAWGQAWRDFGQRGRYWFQVDQLAAARWIAANTPEGDVVGSWTAGIYGYFSQRRVVNLDGVVNWDAIHAYQTRDLYDYMREQRIWWLLDFDEFVGNFTRFFGAEPETFLTPMQVFEDTQAPFGRLVVYAVE
ncbi:MAG: hypothetical protein GY832_20705 [Chloroflexi bacterium]|nr:hypothetical protein [Chloroflexota bacterium]